MIVNTRIEKICFELRSLLEEAVKKNLAEGILLSGGLDTSVLAVVASKFTLLETFTVAFQGFPAPDVKYATLMANRLHLTNFVHYFDEDELYDAFRTVVRTRKSFDPMEVRNSAAILIGLKMAKEKRINTVMTGDGCDELFAGYSFLFNLEKEKLDLELKKLWEAMSFSSIPLAKTLEIEAKLPYLDPNFKAFAMKLDSGYKVKAEKGNVWGKWIVRKAFENILPEEVVWRVKMPIEQGSGTTVLPSVFDRNIADVEFKEKRSKYLEKDKVIIRSKEQLFYYEIYRSVVGVPHPTDPNRRLCPQCNSNVTRNSTYCRTCGAYPI
ncbi:MAG: asparagine synthetase B [Candidatus Bathyarchaeota archaeon BA2]|nr:MAG: asparagine synthetase B [Candidatus Bathyarchaeota archaeon BA2]